MAERKGTAVPGAQEPPTAGVASAEDVIEGASVLAVDEASSTARTFVVLVTALGSSPTWHVNDIITEADLAAIPGCDVQRLIDSGAIRLV